ncbi:hypothetical protein [Robertmurraya sp. P23]
MGMQQQKFKELLVEVYSKGQESDIQVSDMMMEIQQRLNELLESKKQILS